MKSKKNQPPASPNTSTKPKNSKISMAASQEALVQSMKMLQSQRGRNRVKQFTEMELPSELTVVPESNTSSPVTQDGMSDIKSQYGTLQSGAEKAVQAKRVTYQDLVQGDSVQNDNSLPKKKKVQILDHRASALDNPSPVRASMRTEISKPIDQSLLESQATLQSQATKGIDDIKNASLYDLIKLQMDNQQQRHQLQLQQRQRI